MSEKNEIESAIEAGKALVPKKAVLSTDSKEFFIVPQGFIIKDLERRKNKPERATGFKYFVSPQSFCNYVVKHKVEEETIIIADEENGIQAIFNDNGNGPGWGDFGALLKLDKSRQWETWTGLSGEYYSQEEFAVLIENKRSDFMSGKVEDSEGDVISEISPGAFSKMILDLEYSSTTKLKSKIDLTTGARKYSFEDDEIGTGSFSMPKQCVIAIPVFKNGDLIQVVVTFRSKIINKQMMFGFFILTQDEIIEKAFDLVCTRIYGGSKEGIETKHYEGTEVEVYKGIIK